MTDQPGFLEIGRPGLLTLVQDRGRFGWEALGIPQGGAIDVYAYTWANRLALNRPDAAALEATLLGPSFTVTEDTWLATTGAAVTVDGTPVPSWSGFSAPAGATVGVDRLEGARAYIAVRGGIEVDPVLGSRSTDLESHFGGYEARALQAGDVVPIGAAAGSAPGPGVTLRHRSPPTLSSPLTIRAVLGPRADELATEAAALLIGSTYFVSQQSNRIGLRLDGPGIATLSSATRISEPMPIGGIQITPSGQPIVLLNARGTMGGYPLLATVVSTDVWLLGQVRPGDALRFTLIAVEEAQAIARSRWDDLESGRPAARAVR